MRALDNETLASLLELPLDEIERQLGITKEDGYFGRYSNGFPPDRLETPNQAAHREKNTKK